MKQKANLIFLSAPFQIFDKLIPFLTEKKLDNLVFVVPEELKPFLKKYYQDTKIISPDVRHLITKTSKRKLITNTLKLRKEYKEIFSHYEGCNVYLFFVAHSISYFYCITKLRKRGSKVTVVYPQNPLFRNKTYFKRGRGIFAFVMQKYAQWILGVPNYITVRFGSMVWNFDYARLGIEDVRMEREIGDADIPERFRENIPKRFKTLFVGSAPHLHGANFDSVTKVTNELMSVLKQDSLVVKTHPRQKTIYGKMKETKNILPPEILSETLMFHPWEYVIGYNSMSLIKAKKYTSGKVISLIRLYETTDELKPVMIREFERAGILIPETIEEMKKEFV